MGSLRSMGESARSVCSGSTGTSSLNMSAKRDDSFLPLDEDGCCVNHPDVQLAKIRKKGGLKVLLDVCPGKVDLGLCMHVSELHFTY